ncbi:YodC family protein [Paraburkholderia antibiotica]|uniref:YodC family protein n=1 Tax=Paraburkholderia antibiotica TaxID=2728839 RepID=A0A7X9X8R7_9BURK|nr:YodC family protein [Paraburkholderia antibiotica]NML33584.1 YodC family protein [Paraburkholderia antibiotica]
MRLSIRSTKPGFRAGDVLRLKSGGRPMTATWSGPVLFAPGNWLICQWFSDAGELQQEMFPEETLIAARDAALAA